GLRPCPPRRQKWNPASPRRFPRRSRRRYPSRLPRWCPRSPRRCPLWFPRWCPRSPCSPCSPLSPLSPLSDWFDQTSVLPPLKISYPLVLGLLTIVPCHKPAYNAEQAKALLGFVVAANYLDQAVFLYFLIHR